MSKVNLDIGPRPTLAWVKVADIYIDHNYQREIDGNRVEKILRNFNWRDFGALSLVLQANGKFACTDGQHRWKAADLHPAIDEVPAVITEGDGLAGEAQTFLNVNRNRRAVTPIERYWAGLVAGDAEMSRISRVLQTANCDVVAAAGAFKPNHTSAVTALARALRNHGEAATRMALLTIRRAWPTNPQALRGTLITALSRIQKSNKKIDGDRLDGVLTRSSFAQLTAHAENFRKLSGGSAETNIARTIVELYNKGLSVNTIVFGEAA